MLSALLSAAPFWWQYLPGQGKPEVAWPAAQAEPDERDGLANLGVIGFTDGCAPFIVVAQNRWLPYGAAVRTAPRLTAKQIGGRDPNQAIAVDGWVHSEAPYPDNPAPWNSDIWFHLSDGAGWVSFAGVRAEPTFQDQTLQDPDGGAPVPTDPACQGSAQ